MDFAKHSLQTRFWVFLVSFGLLASSFRQGECSSNHNEPGHERTAKTHHDFEVQGSRGCHASESGPKQNHHNNQEDSSCCQEGTPTQNFQLENCPFHKSFSNIPEGGWSLSMAPKPVFVTVRGKPPFVINGSKSGQARFGIWLN